ncbi:hypothetical protein D3C76_183200 [compost metagenome]
MKNWKDAWFIFITDLRGEWLYLLWNIFFMVYLGIMLGGLARTSGEVEFILHPTMDIMMLLLSPMIGFLFSRRSFSYLREDSYSQMLQYYRSLPIPTKVVTLSRQLQGLAAILFNGIFMYGAMYLLPFNLDKMQVSEYLVFVLTWIGYTFLINGIYIHFEFLNKGRTYFWLTILLMICTVIIAFIIRGFGGNVLNYTIESSMKYGFASPVMWGALLIGLIFFSASGKFTTSKLDQRSFIR